MKNRILNLILLILLLPAFLACQSIMYRNEKVPIIIEPIAIDKLSNNVSKTKKNITRIISKEKRKTVSREAKKIVGLFIIKKKIIIQKPVYKKEVSFLSDKNKIEKKVILTTKDHSKGKFQHFGFKLGSYPEISGLKKGFVNYNLIAKLEAIEKMSSQMRLASSKSTGKGKETLKTNYIKDTVKITQSSTRPQKENESERGFPKDELVFYDYSKDENENSNSQNKENKKLISNSKQNFSAPILAAIEREMAPHKKSRKKGKADYSSLIKDKKKIEGNSIKIVASELKFKKGNMDEITTFSYIPAYSRNEEEHADSEGILTIQWKGEKTRNLYGVLTAKGYVRTRFQVNVHVDQEFLEIPMIDRDDVEAFLEEEKIEVQDGIVLVELDSQILDVDLDAEYDSRYFLDHNFTKTIVQEEAKYIMFMNVNPGNVMLKALTTQNDEILEKVVHVAAEEIFFEKLEILSEKKHIFKLFEKDILATSERELPLEKNKIKIFNKEIYSNKLGLNKFSLLHPRTLRGWRRYVLFGHMDDQIFVGVNKSKKIVIPTQDYIENMMNITNTDMLDGLCMIQVEMNRTGLEDVIFDGETTRGVMNIHQYYIDDDGSIGEYPSQNSTRVLFVGESGGMLSAKIDFTDGKSKILNTYCSDGTYLLEHL